MMIPDFTGPDDALEYAARLIEESSLLDLRGAWAKKKRDREDAELRYSTIQETRADCARHIRAFKNRPDLSPVTVLQNIADSEGPRQVLHLMDAWPLAWKGWLKITATITCNSNCCPPETEYRIELTDKGREVLAAASAVSADR